MISMDRRIDLNDLNKSEINILIQMRQNLEMHVILFFIICSMVCYFPVFSHNFVVILERFGGGP